MTDKNAFETATMAKLYVEQGHFQKAADIYRKLLEKDPLNQTYADALADIETLLPASSNYSDDQRLSELISQWISLSIRYNRVRHLEKIKKRIMTP